MKLIYLALKEILPELNIEVIKPSRIVSVFEERNIAFNEVPMENAGCYVRKDGRDYVFLRCAMAQLLYHETICYEGSHALTHVPASFLRWRHNLEAEVMSLISMMPETQLKWLNRIKHQLDLESYELLMKRNLANDRWKL